MKMNKEFQETAYHEAGHAVAHVRLFDNRLADKVTIEPVVDIAGSHRAEELTFPHTEDVVPGEKEAFENEAIYACAGYAALIAAGYSEEEAERGCDSDFQNAEAVCEKALNEVKQEAVLLMSQLENIRAVSRIANELLDEMTLDSEQVEILIAIEDGDTTEEEYQDYLILSGRDTKEEEN